MAITRATVKDIISNLAVFSLPFSVVSIVYFIAYGVAEPLLWALVAPFLLMYFIRKKAKTRFTFVTLHILLIVAAGLLIGDRDSRWFVWVFLGLTALLSLYLKIRQEEISLERTFDVVMFIVLISLFWLLRLAPANPSHMQMQLVGTLLTAKALSILFTHMDNIDYRLNMLSKINGYNGPSGKVVAANNKLIGLFIGGMFFISILVLFGSGLWRLAMAAQQWFVLRLARMMQPFWDAPPPILFPDNQYFEEEIHADQATGVFEMVANAMEELDQEAAFRTFHRVIDVFAVIFFILLICLLCWWFYTYFYKKREDSAPAPESTDTTITLEGSALSDLRDLLPRFKNKNLHPIRKAYAKKVNKHIKSGADISNADTTNIIADKIRAAEDIDALTIKYEKVRYGP